MATSSRLAAHREAARAAADSSTEITPPAVTGEASSDPENEEQVMTEPTTTAAVDIAAATAAANTRWATVLGAEQAVGREATARALLSKTDMSAEDIIATLNDIPVAAAAAPAEGDGEGVAAVLAAIAAAGNVDLGTDGGKTTAEANHGWSEIHADIDARHARR
ncbi:hypothetical protein [Sphingobium sp. HDIP04]|uniref:hypothetical protein n=1 Tax=Sphingobium sp. HDIP04 TaxID=428994 RepID=UPI0003877C52|nr:hypothetical protein [Sphingobium sp. HDIP04]EQA97285.1 hypothetical protein L286_23455 [Sphingobium sp. HDIP04]